MFTYVDDHNVPMPACMLNQFYVLAKCKNKMDCLIIKEMLFIRKAATIP